MRRLRGARARLTSAARLRHTKTNVRHLHLCRASSHLGARHTARMTARGRIDTSPVEPRLCIVNENRVPYGVFSLRATGGPGSLHMYMLYMNMSIDEYVICAHACPSHQHKVQVRTPCALSGFFNAPLSRCARGARSGSSLVISLIESSVRPSTPSAATQRQTAPLHLEGILERAGVDHTHTRLAPAYDAGTRG